MRSLVLLLALVLGVPTTATAAVPRPRTALVEASRVLHGWDARRLAAWRAADPVALRSLYVRGSPVGRRDVRLLRAYDERGYVVRELRTQVFALRVVGRAPGRLRLQVLDRVAGGVVERGGVGSPLPSTPPVTRLVDLRVVDGAWRVAATTAVRGRGRG